MTSISAERSRLANVGMTLRRREQWGARRSYTDARTVSEPATKQFVHITVTNPGNYSSFDRHAQAIEAIGISRFPNTGISYNRLFMAGTRNVYEAQPIGRRGAHTVNDFRRSTCSLSGCPSRGTSLSAPSWNLNYNARAYAYASNVGFSVPDHVIDDMARSMAADRLAGFVTRNATIHGHRCVSAKSCPGDRMWDRMHDLERRVEHYLSNGLDGDTMAWNENLNPTKTAASRFPEGYSTKAEHVVMHILGLTYNMNWGKIRFNAWMRERWGDVSLSPRVLLRSGYGHSREAKERVRDDVMPLLREIRAAQGSAERDQVLADIQAELQAAQAERQSIGDRLDVVTDLLEQVGSGDLSAEQLVEALRQMLHQATAPDDETD